MRRAATASIAMMTAIITATPITTPMIIAVDPESDDEEDPESGDGVPEVVCLFNSKAKQNK